MDTNKSADERQVAWYCGAFKVCDNFDEVESPNNINEREFQEGMFGVAEIRTCDFQDVFCSPSRY